MSGLKAGALRHRIELHERGSTQDPDTGEVTDGWPLFAEVWANVRPLSVREFIAAGTETSKIQVMVQLRYLAGVKPSMRVRHGDRLYQVEGVLPDPISGREWLTLACSEVDEG